ncbi:MAG: hypothetical protein JWL85_218 [Candidatus Saccharibacteria bacterium]|nr:hypothetical protein [Candidatus Saccharibacteria bacterium]
MPRADKLPYRFFDVLIILFVVTLIVSNIGSTKIVEIGRLVFDGGTILFPLAYILGDAITEVYGFRKARRVIWLGFGALLMMVVTLGAIQYMPAATGWDGQVAYERIAGVVPRIALASMAAYLVGEFVNSILLAKLKVSMKGKRFWLRSLGSSVVGQGLDTVIFSLIAFAGTMPNNVLISLMVTVYVMKLVFEVVALPVTYWLVAKLKKHEGIDVYEDPMEVLAPRAVRTT